MRLALIIDDYLPNSTRVGAKMFHELACELQDYGHNVTVITPNWEQKNKISYYTLDGVSIWSFKSGKTKGVNKITRAINESLLSFKAWFAIKDNISCNTFDAIIYYSPSIFFGPLVHRIKECCNCKAYLVLRDLFPQWVIDAGLISKYSVVTKYFQIFERYSYKQADTIGFMSKRNIDVYLKHSKEKLPCNLEVLRNWARLHPEKNTHHYRKLLNLDDKIIFFYGGNIGHAQDMSNLMRLAKNMQSFKNAHFLFIGQGDEVDLINSLAKKWNLCNFTYLPSVSQKIFKMILSEVDIGLFSLSKNHSAHNFPGKLLGYMVQSLPILGSVNKDNDLLPVINQSRSGFIHINGDDGDLLQSAIKLYSDKNLRLSYGKNAFELLRKDFDVKSATNSILTSLGIQNENN
ncbi:TPA: glycosyltransferase family 4 protein [Morganella morganii]